MSTNPQCHATSKHLFSLHVWGASGGLARLDWAQVSLTLFLGPAGQPTKHILQGNGRGARQQAETQASYGSDVELTHHYFSPILLTKTSHVVKFGVKEWGNIQQSLITCGIYGL